MPSLKCDQFLQCPKIIDDLMNDEGQHFFQAERWHFLLTMGMKGSVRAGTESKPILCQVPEAFHLSRQFFL